PRRPGAHRAAGQGAHDPLRSGRGSHDAAEAHQSKGALSRRPRFLRAQPAFAVHGPDQSAGRVDAQTPSLGAGPGRPLPRPRRVDYMDVSPKQLVSVAAGLIPFLEHDDANRALMGSNMQRQAVPLIVTEAPLVATGLEDRVARDSRAVIVADEGGKVASVTGNQIIISKDGKLPEGKKRIRHDPQEGVYVSSVRKFMHSNAATCI